MKGIGRRVLQVCLVGFLLIPSLTSFAQEDEEYWKGLLDTIVERAKPVYKPVISFGSGIMSFYGDVRNPGGLPINGNYGFKANMSTLFGYNNYYKLNFYAIYGKLSGNDFNISRQMQLQAIPLDPITSAPIYPNSSFSTEFFQFGINAEYGFAHLIGNAKKFRPFVSLGVAPIFFNPKGNLTQGGSYYHYWSDGTIRNFPENSPDAWMASIISLDKNYETDLAGKVQDMYGINTYAPRTIAIPFDFGFDFYLSERVNLRVGASVNYTFTDLLDNYNNDIAQKMNYPKKNSLNDIFTFTYFSINLDLFSESKTLKIERDFAMLDDFDYDVMLADQDNDMVFDRFDKCPDTPTGVEVDSVGCPFDRDDDGIYDYMDEEPDTPQGAIVNEKGVQLTQDKLSEMFDQTNAVNRKEIRVVPVAPIWTRSFTFAAGVIPDKFRKVDTDGDGYISFQELLKSIDDYFDEKTTFTPDDIYELNQFFFSQ